MAKAKSLAQRWAEDKNPVGIVDKGKKNSKKIPIKVVKDPFKNLGKKK